MLKTNNLVGTCVLAFLMPFSLCAGADSKWDYAQGGRSGVSDESAGRAGNFRTYECTTSDSSEKVVLWYAKQLGLRKDHSLVTIAEKGFSTLCKSDHHPDWFRTMTLTSARIIRPWSPDLLRRTRMLLSCIAPASTENKI